MRRKYLLLVLATLLICVAILSPGSNSSSLQTATLIRQGDRGDTVRKIQTKLKNWYYYFDKVDGIFGPNTTKAVRYFQSKNGLGVDGIVGPQTAKAMGLTLSGSAGSSGSSSSANNSGDVYLLARLVYGEARGEPYTGKVAVAAVVLNRVKSSKFPNTIAGVIYQPNAFSVVNDGQINLAPDNEALKAARDAMNGWDPSGGAIYYFNPKKTSNAFMHSRPVLAVIGDHKFCS